MAIQLTKSIKIQWFQSKLKEKKNEQINNMLGLRKLGTSGWWQCKWGRCRNRRSGRCERNRGSGGGRDKPCPYRNRTLFASRSSTPPRSSSRLVALRLEPENRRGKFVVMSVRCWWGLGDCEWEKGITEDERVDRHCSDFCFSFCKRKTLVTSFARFLFDFVDLNSQQVDR